MLEDDVKLLAILHISSGSFPLKVKSDRSGVVEIFGKSVQVFLEKNKLKVSDNIGAKQFKGGAEERDYLLEWLTLTLMEV